jgi:hypothetical protein
MIDVSASSSIRVMPPVPTTPDKNMSRKSATLSVSKSSRSMSAREGERQHLRLPSFVTW